jgi:ribosomal protein S11
VGMVRKMASLSTAGAVGFRSSKEKKAHAAVIQAKAAKTEAKALKKIAKQGK